VLARAERLVSAADYRGTVRRGRRASSELMTVYSVVNPVSDSWRFGFIVSKAVGNAVIRNRVRRRLKAICHSVQLQRRADIAFDVVLRAHSPAAAASFESLEETVVALIARSTARHGEQSEKGKR
jgi:ribonuclease P protein component